MERERIVLKKKIGILAGVMAVMFTVLGGVVWMNKSEKNVVEDKYIVETKEMYPIEVVEGIERNALPFPHQVIYDTATESYQRGRIELLPVNDPDRGWREDGKAYNANEPGVYPFIGVIQDENIINAMDYSPQVNVVVKKAGIVSLIVKDQVGPSDIDDVNQRIHIKVLPGTDLKKLAPMITLTDNTVSNINNGDFVDFSNGPVEYIIESESGNSYSWMVSVDEAKIQAEIFVAPDGDGVTGDGTKEKPFQTLTQARDYVREINNDMTGNILIYLRGGHYTLAEPVVLNHEDSGTNGYSIVYKAYEKEVPVLFGGRRVENWVPDEKEGVYKAPAPEGVTYSRELYVNGRRTTIARDTGVGVTGWGNYSNKGMGFMDGAEYPKEMNGRQVHEGYKTNVLYQYKDLWSWRNISDIEFCYLVGWTYHIIPVEHVENGLTGQKIYMKKPAFDLVQSGIGGDLAIKDPNYIQNAYELLDEPGESYFDREEGYIYYIPRENEDVNTIEAFVPITDELLLGKGTSEKNISHVQFNGINFQCTGFKGANDSEGAVTGQASYIKTSTGWNKMSGAVKFDYANNIIFDQCDFRMIGKGALDFNEVVRDNIIMGSSFDGIGASAIQIGDKGTDETAHASLNQMIQGNKVISNRIYNVGESFNGAIGIWAGFARDTIIAFNEIKYVSYTGISTGWSWGHTCPTPTGNNIIEYNHIRHVLEKLHDGGSIYVLGYQPASRIRGNHVHDVTGAPGGIYFDEGSSGYTDISENVIYRISEELPDVFFFNYYTGYWNEHPDKEFVVEKLNAVMRDNFPHNRLTYPKEEGRINPEYPDMENENVKKTINNAGIHRAYY